MKLLVKTSGNNVVAGNSLPAGVRPLETLTSGYMLVDASDAGAQLLRSNRALIVQSPGNAYITPPGEFGMRKLSDIERKVNEVKARRAKVG